MDTQKEQQLIMDRIARIATIHDTMNKEIGVQKPATILATVSAATSSLIQSWLNAKDPMMFRAELDGVLQQTASCFIILIHLCGSLNVEPLTLIDEEYAKQLKNLDLQRAMTRAMNEVIERNKNGASAS